MRLDLIEDDGRVKRASGYIACGLPDAEGLVAAVDNKLITLPSIIIMFTLIFNAGYSGSPSESVRPEPD